MSLLKEAIIDAKQLQETALSTAREMLVEKYSQEFKEVLDRVLEQDDPLALGDEETGLAIGADPSISMPAPQEPSLDVVPPSAGEGTSNCPCPDQDEEIEINLTDLFNQEPSPEMGSGMELPPFDQGQQSLGEETQGVILPVELAGQLLGTQQGPSSVAYKVGQMAYAGEKITIDLLKQAYEELASSPEMASVASQLKPYLGEQSVSSMTEELFSLLEEDQELQDMLEGISFDYEALPNGRSIGTPSALQKEQEIDTAIAINTIDEEEAEQNKAIVKNVEKLMEAFNKQQEDLNTVVLFAKKQETTFKEKLLNVEEKNKQLQTILNETLVKVEKVNLQNARLYYQNRVLKSDSLNERQKEKVVEAISSTDSVQKAKAIFEALQNGFPVKEQNTKKGSLQELNKNNTLIIKRNTEKEPVNEQVERFRKLAGIK